MKLCKSCLKEKSLQEFNKNKISKDGKDRICRECNKLYCKAWQKKNMISLKYLGDHGWRKEINLPEAQSTKMASD